MPLQKLSVPRGIEGIKPDDLKELVTSGAADVVEWYGSEENPASSSGRRVDGVVST